MTLPNSKSGRHVFPRHLKLAISMLLALHSVVGAMAMGAIAILPVEPTQVTAPAHPRMFGLSIGFEVGPGSTSDEQSGPRLQPALRPDPGHGPSHASLVMPATAGSSLFSVAAPHEGSLWDRIPFSAQQDWRAYLLGTAIQVHAPAAAITPRLRENPRESRCGCWEPVSVSAEGSRSESR